MKYRITITKLNSKNIEKILLCEDFETRNEAEYFVKKCKALPIEYKLKKNIKYYKFEGIIYGTR